MSPDRERKVDDGPLEPRFLLRFALPTFVLLLLAIWPLVLGLETLFFRDVFNTHLEMKWWQNEAMHEGFVPLVDPYRSGGQPHLGNPNTVALYPSNFLYLFAPFLWAFNAHFWVHLLVAPLGAFWLARKLGLSRPGAWAAGVFYGASGYLLSNLNLYNLIAGAALIPAFAASVLGVSADPGRRWRVVATAALWSLLILAGDPMTAAIGLAVAASALWLAPPDRRGWWSLLLPLGAGTILAAPLLVEFARIVGLSFRGHWGFSTAGATEASWHPGAILEWFVPFAFGRPNLAFWGHRFYSGAQPLFYSFYPGLLAVVCFFLGLAGRRRLVFWALALAAIGLFLALGGYNPIIVRLLDLPGMDLLRLPVKFWPLVAVATAIVAGMGFERCFEAGGAGRLRLVALALAAVYGAAWVGVTLAGTRVESTFASWMPAVFAQSGLAAAERSRWSGLLIQLAALAVALALSTILRPQIFKAMAPAFLVAHLALQLVLLRPLYPFEPVGVYASVPGATVAIPEGATAVHGASGGLFGTVAMPLGEYPSPDPRWLQRQVFNESYPPVGMMQRRYFEFALSPEGLDSFLTRATTHALPMLSDAQRLRLLAASGVEWLYMKRELSVVDGVELVERFPSLAGDLLLYRVAGAADPAQFVSEFVFSETLNDALATLTSADFRPREQAVIAGSGRAGSGMKGSVEAVPPNANAAPETLTWRVTADGAGALLLQRTFLPIYRVEVDGERVTPWLANMHRIAVPVGAGTHEVRLGPDRIPFRLATGAALLTALGLLIYVARALPKRRITLDRG